MRFFMSFGVGMMLLAAVARGEGLPMPGLLEQVQPGEKPRVVESAAVVTTAPITHEEMQHVFDEAQTPFKYGIVVAQEGPGMPVDCPNVFRYGPHWYMVYVCYNHIGYETKMAKSDDLLHWEGMGTILPFRRTEWDAWQADASISLYSMKWGDAVRLEDFDDKYWLTYIGGSRTGYEPDPLATGLAYNVADDPTSTQSWVRHPDNPVIQAKDPGSRAFESTTIYKTSVIWDHAKTLGWNFVMYYNGKQLVNKKSTERIGMAVSDDMVHWRRYGTGPVVDNGKGISGDPQITRIGDLYVMFYFGAGWGKFGGAFDTFAVSRDLVHWTKWDGPPLLKPSELYDKTFAHKPWIFKYKGVVYHFYCAVGKKGRSIALATSKDFLKQ